MKMSYWKVFLKLMSRHWKSHLGFPLIVGVVVEPMIGFLFLKDRTLGDYIVSREGFISHISIIGIIITYLCVAVWYIHKDAKTPWTNKSGEQLNEVLTGATSFFATCTIPLEQWFHPDTQKYFSDLVKRKLPDNKLPQHRVLLFKETADLSAAQEQYLDAFYSKTLVSIHQNYEIPLGYLEPDEIGIILKKFTLKGQAALWENLKVRAQIDLSKESRDPTCDKLQDEKDTSKRKESDWTISTLDFAVVGNGKDQYKVYTFDKSGDYIKLEVLKDPNPYVNLRNEIRTEVFNNRGLSNAAHSFAVHCAMEPLKIDQGCPFVD